MNSRYFLTALSAGLLGGPLLLAFEPRADAVDFTPSDGSSLTKEFQVQFEMVLGDLTLLASGQDVSESVPADFEISTEMNMTVVDTYVEMQDGKPLDLIRLYDTLEAIWETPDDSGSADEGPFVELAGKQVRFKWNEDDETYDVSYHESEGDDEALENLGVDMDMRAMLPGDEVSEGDTWSLEPQQVASLMLFGTELDDFSMEMDEDPMGIGPLVESELAPQLESMLDGLSAECTYQGQQEVDGATVGSIEVAIEGDGTIDLSGLILGLIEAQVPEGMDIAIDIDEAIVSLSMEAEGALLWDLEGGHMHSFELSPEVEILVDILLSIDVGGETQDIEASVELLGSGDWSAATVQ